MKRVLPILLLGLATLGAALGQSDFQVTALYGGASQVVPSGGALTVTASNVGQRTFVNFTVVYTGSSIGTIQSLAFTGTSEMAIASAPSTPVSLAPNASVGFSVEYLPSTGSAVSGQVAVGLYENSQPSSYQVTLNGSAPNLTLTYFFQPNGSPTALGAGGITFPATNLGSTATATLTILNTGGLAGTLQSVTLSGAAYQLSGTPTTPLSLPPGQQVSFNVSFAPQSAGGSLGLLVLSLNGNAATIGLSGTGSAPTLSVSYVLADGNVHPLPDGTAISFPAVALNATTSATVAIQNQGAGSGTVSGIAVSGAGFNLSNSPLLPATVAAGQTLAFGIVFAPPHAGSFTGTFTLTMTGQSVSGTLAGSTTGSQLTYTYTSGTSAATLLPGGTISMADSAVGESTSVTVSVMNAGAAATTIASIGLNASGSVFTLQNLPSLPLNLNPGGTASFAVGFSPSAIGTTTAVLNVNGDAFGALGTGLPPPSLPAYQFQGPSGAEQAAQQPSVGLSLATPYPLPLQGALTLTFVSSVFTDDPAIQFASGGRTVAFTIPANSAQALFNGTATSIPLQTGTTAGSIVITPAFALQNGFTLTPSSPPVLTMTVAAAAPQLVSGSIASETLDSFSLVLNGYVTARSLKQLTVQVTPKSGESFSTTSLTVDLTSSAAAWFQSAASSDYGGAFQIAIPFVLSNGSTTDDLVHDLQSLSITAGNGIGSSSALSVTIP
jgi:hypothetical protein